MDQLTTPEYVKPYKIKELGDELGLTAHDISRSLGAPIENVLKKLRRDKWRQCREWSAIPYGILNENNGLTYSSFALDLRAAKAFVARWVNSAGDGYLNYLFDCESRAEYEIPKLLEIINRLMARKVKRTSKGVFIVREKCVYIKDMFGESFLEIQKEQIPLSAATELEMESYRIKHRQRVMSGLVNAQTKSLVPEDGKLRLVGNRKIKKIKSASDKI